MISERNQVLFRLKLHHIGIVVKNIQESLGELTNFLNFESTAVPTLVGSQKVNVCFLKTNNVLVLEIDSKGILLSKKFYNMDDMNNIKFDEDKTSLNYSKRSFVYSFLSSLRQKIDDPLNKKRIKK